MCLLFLPMLCFLPTVSAESDCGALLDELTRYKLSQAQADSVQQWLDGELAAGAGMSSEWYALSLAHEDNACDFTGYVSALKKYAEGATVGVVTSQKYALAMLAAGGNDSGYIASVTEKGIGAQGVMSVIYSIHLMANGCEYSGQSVESAAEQLLSMQLADGGWAVSGSVSDVDVTAMALQALAHCSSEAELAAPLSLLSSKQLEDGGFSSYGKKNAESAAQVIIALDALGIDWRSDSRFIKNGCTVLDGMLKFRLADGGFCHEENGQPSESATMQAFCALTAVCADGSFYDYTEPETVTVTETSATETSRPQETVQETVREKSTSGSDSAAGNYKLPVCIAIIAAALVLCVIMRLSGRKKPRVYLPVLVLTALALAFVLATEFRSANEYYGAAREEKENVVGTVVMSISCGRAAGMYDTSHTPADGIILAETSFDIASGDTVYTILTQAAREFGIQLDASATLTGKMAYVRGISHLYEFDCGELSGWIYTVNGMMPSEDCASFILSDGDIVEWIYSPDMDTLREVGT